MLLQTKRRNVKRQIKKLEANNWQRTATEAADSGNMKAFALLNEALNRKAKEGCTPFHEQCAAARDAIASLTQPPPAVAMNMPGLPEKPKDFKSSTLMTLQSFTDGSKYHQRSRKYRT